MQDAQRAKLGEFIGLVQGNVPELETGGLTKTHALFQGLRRPHKNHANDSGIYIYVTSPGITFRYRHREAEPTTLEAPIESVFVAYADVPESDEAAAVMFKGSEYEVLKPRGLILGWEWTYAHVPTSGGQVDPLLPKNYDRRYARRVW